MAKLKQLKLSSAGKMFFRPEAASTLKLALVEFHGTMAAGKPFRFDLVLRRSQRRGLIDTKEVETTLVGRPVGFGLKGPEGQNSFHGYVSRCVTAKPDEFHITIVPWTALLTYTLRSRVFVGMSVPDVLTAVFDGACRKDYRWAINKPEYSVLERIVQYQESDAAFVARLCERVGIATYWEFEGDRHTLVLADGTVPPAVCAGGPFLIRRPAGRGEARTTSEITSWQRARALTPGRVTIDEYDHRQPNADLQASLNTRDPDPTVGTFGVVWSAAGHTTPAEAAWLARVRVEQVESARVLVSGTSTAPSFIPGQVVVATERGRPSDPHLLVNVRHSATQSGYENDFQCVPLAQGYRPICTTRVPFIPGYQTAVVVGADGRPTPGADPVYSDKHGRVKVRFRWDLSAKDRTDPSGWVRVAHAGGTQRTPRIGEEVTIVWEHGDVDRPLIVASSYPTPSDAPYAPARSMLRQVITQPTADATKTANEVRMDSKLGAERLAIGSIRNVTLRAGQDLIADVGADLAEFVSGDHIEEISGCRWTRVGKEWLATAQKFLVEAAKELILKSEGPIHIEAPEVTLVGGGSFLRLSRSGAEIEGPVTLINCGGCVPTRPVEKTRPPTKVRPNTPGRTKTGKRK